MHAREWTRAISVVVLLAVGMPVGTHALPEPLEDPDSFTKKDRNPFPLDRTLYPADRSRGTGNILLSSREAVDPESMVWFLKRGWTHPLKLCTEQGTEIMSVIQETRVAIGELEASDKLTWNDLWVRAFELCLDKEQARNHAVLDGQQN